MSAALLPVNPEALAKAQALAEQAMQSSTPEEVVRLCKLALEACDACADAWVLIAEVTAESAEQALPMLDQAVQGAVRALGGEEGLSKWKGKFWSDKATQPYMRARALHAQALWDCEQPEAAMDELVALLQLNPQDHQGNRWMLALWLVEAVEPASREPFFQQYAEDPTPIWCWLQALHRFELHGPGELADSALAAAKRSNTHVAEYLLERSPFPNPDDMNPDMPEGGPEEGALVASQVGLLWASAEGALAWLDGKSSRLILPN